MIAINEDTLLVQDNAYSTCIEEQTDTIQFGLQDAIYNDNIPLIRALYHDGLMTIGYIDLMDDTEVYTYANKLRELLYEALEILENRRSG